MYGFQVFWLCIASIKVSIWVSSVLVVYLFIKVSIWVSSVLVVYYLFIKVSI